jgi:hypothetical protein
VYHWPLNIAQNTRPNIFQDEPSTGPLPLKKIPGVLDDKKWQILINVKKIYIGKTLKKKLIRKINFYQNEYFLF